MFLILGDQLFYNDARILGADRVVMIESYQLFTRYRYHKAKIAYMLTCMREFRDYLLSHNVAVEYYDIEHNTSFEHVIQSSQEHITLYEPSDKSFRQQLYRYFSQFGIEYEVLDSPHFLTTSARAVEYLQSQKNKQLKMHDFYIHQRKTFNILMKGDQPFMGTYSFDEENRKKLPKNHSVQNSPIQFKTKNYSEVVDYVNRTFAQNSGELQSSSYFPLNYEQAITAFENFLEYRLRLFGPYEDALSTKDPFLYHSGLSACMNNGILSPHDILNRLETYLRENYQFSIYQPTSIDCISSIEGYIRQIIGWREWIKIMSEYVYQDISSYNFFDSHHALPDYFWDLNNLQSYRASMPYPIYNALKNLHQTGYNHHIERLMVLANYMTITEIDPKEMYSWFMSMYVDAYEWVMVPNVFGMGSFADGGIFATKPYIAGGNYIKKMSDYEHSKEWEHTFTDPFWEFLMKHETYFSTNYRMKMLISARKNKLASNN